MSQDEFQPVVLPVLPLRDVVVYPHMVIPLFVGREKSMRALDKAMADLVEVEVPRLVQLYAPVVTADNVDQYIDSAFES